MAACADFHQQSLKLSCAYSRAEGGQFFLNFAVDLSLGEFRCHANSVFYGVSVGGTMRDKTYSLHTEQRRATVFSVIQTLFKICKCIAGEPVSNLACNRCLQGFFQRAAN